MYSLLPLKGDNQRKTGIAFFLENGNKASSKNLPFLNENCLGSSSHACEAASGESD
jgi:hypothetical protein